MADPAVGEQSPTPFTRRPAFHLLLLLLTALSVFSVYLFVWGGGVEGDLSDRAWGSAFFTFSVLLILGAHEMGHYLMARAHGVDATLPYFIPIPLGFGTLGAVIRLKGRVPTRNALVDIGAAGPLCGLLVAVPLLAVGITLSSPIEVPESVRHFPPQMSLWHYAELLGQWARHTFRDGPPLPAEADSAFIFGDNLLGLALVRLLHGRLAEGTDLAAHPVLVAGWFGMLVTMLNLLPVGQLDGGHLTHAWFDEKAVRLGRAVAGALLPLALFCSASWLVWFFLVTRVVRFGHPSVTAPEEPLTFGRKVVCVACFVATVLTFMPVPLDVG
ncbi:MAG: site-2 protease family protein [Myxococcales bacterium]|nr:site-2 protease family protein [Myxococcales bacterium]